jgi:hypothetical protein
VLAAWAPRRPGSRQAGDCDRLRTYQQFKIAALRIREGADFIGTNGDRTFPTPEGLVPGNGSLLALVQAATDKEPVVIGKPEAAMFEVALDRVGADAAQTLMVGDRLETDILGRTRAGCDGSAADGHHTPEESALGIQADGVFETLMNAAWAANLKPCGSERRCRLRVCAEFVQWKQRRAMTPSVRPITSIVLSGRDPGCPGLSP